MNNEDINGEEDEYVFSDLRILESSFEDFNQFLEIKFLVQLLASIVTIMSRRRFRSGTNPISRNNTLNVVKL